MAFGIESALPLVGAGLGALIGGDEPPGLTPEQRRIWRLLIKRYQAEHRYSNSPTLSTPVERQSLSQAQGLQSEAAGRSRAGLFSQNGVNDLANNPMIARQVGNLGAAEQAQSSALYGQFALQGLQDRNNVRHNVLPQLLGQAGSMAGNPAMPGQSSGWESLMPLLQQAGYVWGQSRSQGSNPMVNGQSVDAMGNAMGPGGTTFGTPGGGSIPVQQWQRPSSPYYPHTGSQY